MKQQKGFTIVEIAVVIVVIALIATITIVAFSQVQKQSRDKKREADVLAFQTALEKYYDKNGEYPTDSTSAQYLNPSWDQYPNSGQRIGNTTTLTQLRTIAPNLDNNFGDPLRPKTSSQNAYFQSYTAYGAGYFYLGGWSAKADGYAYQYTAKFWTSDPAAAAYSCSYKTTGYKDQTMTYIIGYYSEQKDAWVLKRGQQGKLFEWNIGNNPRCNLSN